MYLDICIFLAFLFCALHRVMYFSCLASHCTVQLNGLISLTSLPSHNTTLQSHHIAPTVATTMSPLPGGTI